MLEGGPFASEEATWAEIALREPREGFRSGRAMLGPTEPSGPGAPSSQSMIADAHGHSGCVWRKSGQGDKRERRQQGMRVPWRKMLAVVGIATILEACAFQSGTTYAPGETGTVMRVEVGADHIVA